MKTVNETDIEITVRLVDPINLEDLGVYSINELAKMIGHDNKFVTSCQGTTASKHYKRFKY